MKEPTNFWSRVTTRASGLGLSKEHLLSTVPQHTGLHDEELYAQAATCPCLDSFLQGEATSVPAEECQMQNVLELG